MTHRRRSRTVAVIAAMLLAPALARGAHAAPTTPAAPAVATAVVDRPVTVAVVGDYGVDDSGEQAVATMIGTWSPDMVVTTGDNDYVTGGEAGALRYDRVVGKYYCAFLRDAVRGPGCPSGGTSPVNRFFPATGNHEYDIGGIANYLGAFTLPGTDVLSMAPSGNERYYDVRNGPVQFFVIDSQGALDSASDTAAQRAWLQAGLASSTAAWKIVVFHHPPYSSSTQHGSTPAMAWPFATWGADLVLNGHDHTYERIERDGISFMVDGLGGAPRYTFGTPVTGSTARFNAEFGALRLRIDRTTLTSELVTVSGTVYDRSTRTKAATVPVDPVAAPSRFVAADPARVLDTRSGIGAPAGRVAPGGLVELQLAGVAGVPAGATAAVLNLTLDDATGPGYVQALPTGRAAIGDSSNLNAETAGASLANLVVVPLGAGGRVTLYAQGGGHLVADLLGWFTASGATSAGRYVALAPARVLDTRLALGTPGRGAAPVEAGGLVQVQLRGRGGIPAQGVAAVALQLTVTDASPGYVQVLAGGRNADVGAWSNLNVRAHVPTQSNLVVVPVGADGTVLVHVQSRAHLIADVQGWFTDPSAESSTAGRYVPARPVRLLDTRLGLGAATKLAAAATATLPLRIGATGAHPAGVARAVFANVTATETTAAGYVQVMPSGEAAIGSSSTLNATAEGRTVANAALVTLSSAGDLAIYSETGTHALVDVAGWFTAW